MKKLLSLVVILLISIGIFFAFDYIQYRIIIANSNEVPKKCYLEQLFGGGYFTSHSINFHKLPFERKRQDYRKNIFNNSLNSKQPILVFGCSFANGYLLDDKDTFSNKLSLKTKRNVYNMALCACGIQHMYHLLKDKDFFQYINNNETKAPEYLIYVYIPSHLQRVSSSIFPSFLGTDGENLIYELKNNSLILKKYLPVINRTYLVKKLKLAIEKRTPPFSREGKLQNFELAKKLFIESKKILEQNYPNIKFVILRYRNKKEQSEFEIPFMWEYLEEEGFIIIDSKDLINRMYTEDDTAEDKIHPNAQAWDELIPPLIKKLNL